MLEPTMPFVTDLWGFHAFPWGLPPLLAAPLEKSNPAWQFRQWTQRFSEWLEVQTAGWRSPTIPEGPKLPVVPSQVWEVLFWLVVISFILWILWWVVRWLDPYWAKRQRDRSPASFQSDRTDSPKSAADWYKLAQTYQTQHNYAEGCRALYMAMLQQLSDRQMIPLETSRTDGEYLRLLTTLRTPRTMEACQTLIQVHEQICYEQAIASEPIFLKCQQAYQTVVDQLSLLKTER
ncbi:DUF4129 domain-containing protein [Alkalinema sp. FACHB-956]|uniref:DUF4129 domain-containing protein n=1 Tax=Alkalinema sp. FACHB-956 TaxID=2692768 RepID=UPI001686A14F|nr:DUF4129 domain-containing protein [Alkalinema sp. FACHB-956]MBD2328114.1 DUF4129 domain-containing protein [Alkalinema sp. FACHB-956]